MTPIAPKTLARLVESGLVKLSGPVKTSTYNRWAYLRRRKRYFAAGLTAEGKQRQRYRRPNLPQPHPGTPDAKRLRHALYMRNWRMNRKQQTNL